MVMEKVMTFDVERIREDFPALKSMMHGKPLVYLDSAASSQKPEQVIAAMDQVYRTVYANVHRGVYTNSEVSTELYDQARAKIAHFINASTPEQVIFVRNATEALNLLAYSYGRHFLKEGDEVVLTQLEHHANFVPWLVLAQERGVKLKYIPLASDGTLDLSTLPELLTPRVKLVTFAHVSNVLGTITDPRLIIEPAHAIGARVIVDGCQAAPHMPVDVQELDCDFYAFSGHKMLGPTGIGVLYGKPELLDAMPPFLTGGDMINSVSMEGATWADVPAKFEAGTPAFVQAIGLGAAVDYLTALRMDAVREHERELVRYGLERLSELSGLTLLGPTDPSIRGGALSFTVKGIHPHDLGTLLDREGIAVRTGHHCAQPLHTCLGLTATARASFYIYNEPREVDALAEGIEKAKRVLHK